MYSQPSSPPPGYYPPNTPTSFQQVSPVAANGHSEHPPLPPDFQPSFPEAHVVNGYFGGDSKAPMQFGYYVSSAVPTKQVLLRQEAVVPEECPAVIHRTTHDVTTHDRQISEDMDSLFQYFLFYLREKPGLFIHVHGSHTEYRTVHRRYKDSQGFTHTETHQEKHTVTDFDFRIDASNYVSNDWSQIVAVPKTASPVAGEWKAVLEQFTKSKNLLKEIHMQKEVVWDYTGLELAILSAIRMSGYSHDITIKFEKSNEIISAHSASALSKIADNIAVRVLCVVTCLCIIFAPLYFITRRNVKNQLYAYYLCAGGDGRMFYDRNIASIVNLVMNRVKCGTYPAY